MDLDQARNKKSDLIVALDFASVEQARACVVSLEKFPVIFKVGLELFVSGGPSFVQELVDQGKRVFLDLKFHDIPNTVARAAKQAALFQVEMMTVHIAGGSKMLKAVSEEFAALLDSGSPLARKPRKPKILGVSVLTSFDDQGWAEVTGALTGHASSPSESVRRLVEASISWGLDGLVCSALELQEIQKKFPHLYTVVPGIRLEGSLSNDQARISTPRNASRLGAGAIVVGRPITESSNPARVVERILGELVASESS
jgi:orotidine-5'-phosphate decarboxylase